MEIVWRGKSLSSRFLELWILFGEEIKYHYLPRIRHENENEYLLSRLVTDWEKKRVIKKSEYLHF